MSLFIHFFIFCCSVWVINDAFKNGIESPSKWGIGTAALWIIVFPTYLFKRKKLIKKSREKIDDSDTNIWIKDKKEPSIIVSCLIVLTITAGSYTYWLMKGDLPTCDSKEVSNVLDSIVNGVSYSEQVQQNYEPINEIRHCNLTASGHIASYTVSWYSENKDKFMVKFN